MSSPSPTSSSQENSGESENSANDENSSLESSSQSNNISELPPPHPRVATLSQSAVNTGADSQSPSILSSLASSQQSSQATSPTLGSSQSAASHSSNPPSLSLSSSTFHGSKSSLTASMNDSARVDVKPFPYQPSKALKIEGEEEFTLLEALPADSRYETEIVHVQVSRADAAYQLQPLHCGRQVVFLNAANSAFYHRELASPSLHVWLLAQMPIEQSHALKRLFESGWRQNIQVKVMEINKFELVASKDGLENILYEGHSVELPDAVINRVGASVSYFGLAVIRQLENMNCLILNMLKSIEISRDKMLTVQCLAAHGLPIPKTILAKFPMNLDTIQREFDYPIIIKKVSGSQGKGIIKVDTHGQLVDLVDMLDTGKPLIFQEFIAASSGKDLRVFVIGGRVVGAMMRIAAKGNFKANVHAGGSVKPVKISPQVEWLVLETVKIIGLDIAGVDLLIDKNTYKICEVNSSPGFEGLEKALGENIAIKMFLYLKMRLGVWRRGAKGKGINSVTVPVTEDGNEDAIVGNNYSNNSANSNISPSPSQTGEPPINTSSNNNGSNNNSSNTLTSVNGGSVSSVSGEDRDRFRTLPRNRSMKRST